MNDGMTPRLSDKGKTPKYLRIYNWIHAMIRKGRLAVGDQIPTEQELAGQFKASRMTVRKAIDPLVLEGILERRPGQGTFVISGGADNLTYDAGRPIRFFHMMEELNMTPRFDLIEKKIVQADQTICDYLHLISDRKVIAMTIVLYADDTPVIIEKSYYPYREFEKLMEMEISQPPMALLDKEFNVQLKRARQFISAVSAGEKEMALFHVDEPIPCIYLEWISYDEDKIPFNVCLCHYRGDAFKFKIPSCEVVRPGTI